MAYGTKEKWCKREMAQKRNGAKEKWHKKKIRKSIREEKNEKYHIYKIIMEEIKNEMCKKCGSVDDFCPCIICICGNHTCNVEHNNQFDYKIIGDRLEMVCTHCHEKYCIC